MEPTQSEQTSVADALTVVERAVREGVRRALLRHKLLGEWIAVFQDGRVVRIPAGDIEIEPPDEPADLQANRVLPDGHEH